MTTVSGEQVDLGSWVNRQAGPAVLLQDLAGLGYVPVVASIGVTPDGSLLT